MYDERRVILYPKKNPPHKQLKLGKRKNTQIVTTQKPLKMEKLQINQILTLHRPIKSKTQKNPKFNTSKIIQIRKT